MRLVVYAFLAKSYTKTRRRVSRMRAARHLLTIALTFAAMGTANAQEAIISVAEAKSLVGIVLRHRGFPSSSQFCEIEHLDKDGDPFEPRLLRIWCFLRPSKYSSYKSLGHLVSPRTGDVLEYDFCRWFGYPDLRRMQKRIMLRTHATEAAEVQYRQKTGCTKVK